jgi:GNAT superfamily N-acetyltransferase
MAERQRGDPLTGVKVAREPLAALRADPELPRLVLEYHEEVGSPAIQPDPDWRAMAELETRGELLCLAARRDGALVGFAVWRLFTPLGFRKLRLGWAEFLYLAPEARARGGAARLLAASENAMRAEGVHRCAIHDSAEAPREFGPLGYGMAMRVWLKDL